MRKMKPCCLSLEYLCKTGFCNVASPKRVLQNYFEEHYFIKPVSMGWRPWHGEEKNFIGANAIRKVISECILDQIKIGSGQQPLWEPINNKILEVIPFLLGSASGFLPPWGLVRHWMGATLQFTSGSPLALHIWPLCCNHLLKGRSR